MPTIIHFYAAFLSKQVHLDSKVSLKNPYCNGFSCTVQDFAILSGEYPPLRMMLGERVALEEGPMIIYGSGGGARGEGDLYCSIVCQGLLPRTPFSSHPI